MTSGDDRTREQEATDAALLAQQAALLKTRLVREPTRDTLFVINESDEALTELVLPTLEGRYVRRVHVNMESADVDHQGEWVRVTCPTPLRAGASTIVSIHYR